MLVLKEKILLIVHIQSDVYHKTHLFFHCQSRKKNVIIKFTFNIYSLEIYIQIQYNCTSIFNCNRFTALCTYSLKVKHLFANRPT